MEYLITFLEGLVTFISPCLLPMLPIYLSYLAGGSIRENKASALRNAVGFVLGFSITFIALGALAGTLGAALRQHQTAVNIVSGLIVILFGLSFLGVLPFELFRGIRSKGVQKTGFFPSVVFGMVFSVGWTPCVGAFLGSALMLASQQGSTVKGVLLLISPISHGLCDSAVCGEAGRCLQCDLRFQITPARLWSDYDSHAAQAPLEEVSR